MHTCLSVKPTYTVHYGRDLRCFFFAHPSVWFSYTIITECSRNLCALKASVNSFTYSNDNAIYYISTELFMFRKKKYLTYNSQLIQHTSTEANNVQWHLYVFHSVARARSVQRRSVQSLSSRMIDHFTNHTCTECAIDCMLCVSGV